MGLLDASPASAPAAWDLPGLVLSNAPVSSGLWRLDLELPRPVPFEPGQFAMLHPRAHGQLVFRRPFSILASADKVVSFLYRVVGRGTAMMADLRPHDPVDCLAPLGRPFPAAGSTTSPVLVLAGGVGLPPLHAWWARGARPGDLFCFGGRDGGDVPWSLLPDPWRISVDQATGLQSGRAAHHGLVTALAMELLQESPEPSRQRLVLACGPTPLLRAAARLAAERGWPCLVSLEEHMGCGYGVCKGCVVPVLDPGPAGWRNANSCTEGPVFDAADLDWDRFGAHHHGGGA